MNGESNEILQGKRVGIFGKGGSGKSTITALLAHTLLQEGYRVAVLDADSTNVGLPEALGLERPPKTLLDYYGGMVFSGGSVTCPVDDPTPLPDADLTLDDLSPSYYARNDRGLTLLTAGKIGDLGPGAGCDGPVTKIARDLHLHEGQGDPITLIDFKAGFEDSARGAVTGLDWGLMVVDPTTASLEMAVNMRDMVNQIKQGVLPATAHLETPELVAAAHHIFQDATIQDLFFILNRVPDDETERYLREKLAASGIEPIGMIHADSTIPTAWLKGKPIATADSLQEAARILERLKEAANGRM